MVCIYRILYVDDEPALLESGKRFLERNTDFAVDTSISAMDALNRIGSETFDAIISDYQMPGLDGIDLLKQV